MPEVTVSTDDLFWHHAAVLANPYGEKAVDIVGYIETEKGVLLKSTREQGEDFVAELDGPAWVKTLARSVSLELALKQLTSDTLALALGVEKNGFKVTVGGGVSADLEYEVRVVGQMKSRRPLHMILPRAVTEGDVETAWMKKKAGSIPLAFKGQDGAHKLLIFEIGRNATTATIATGDVDRSQTATGGVVNGISWLLANPEASAASDTIDTVTALTGTVALTNGELLRIQPAASGKTLTLAHAASGTGVLQNKSAGSIVLSSIYHWADYYYDADDTAWKEIAHYVG